MMDREELFKSDMTCSLFCFKVSLTQQEEFTNYFSIDEFFFFLGKNRQNNVDFY